MNVKSTHSWMYNFQCKQRRKAIAQTVDSETGVTKADCLDAKDANGNINAIEAIALASEAKGQLNGIVTNVIHENLEQAEHAAECVQRDTEARAAVVAQAQTLANGMENRAFEGDEVELRQRQQTRV